MGGVKSGWWWKRVALAAAVAARAENDLDGWPERLILYPERNVGKIPFSLASVRFGECESVFLSTARWWAVDSVECGS